MFEVIAEQEGLCAQLVAPRITPDERGGLLQAHEACQAMAESGNHDGFCRENRRFHEIVYSASRNQFLREATQALRNRVGPYRQYVTYQPGRMAASELEHTRR